MLEQRHLMIFINMQLYVQSLKPKVYAKEPPSTNNLLKSGYFAITLTTSGSILIARYFPNYMFLHSLQRVSPMEGWDAALQKES